MHKVLFVVLYFLTLISACGALPDITNGIAVTPNGTTHGSYASYSCNLGYSLSHTVNRTCLQTRMWSYYAPVCGMRFYLLQRYY